MINHKTADEFRREVATTGFFSVGPQGTNVYRGDSERTLNEVIDAYEAKEKACDEMFKIKQRTVVANMRLKEFLTKIANSDYRGNRSTESQMAFEALNEK